MKRSLSAFLVLTMLAIGLTGCEPLRKKFTRKKKAPVKAPRIYQVKEYIKKPSEELYQKHYSYWMTWNSELLRVLGQNHKKDVLCIEEIVGNLKDMQNILVKEKGDELQPHIKRLEGARDVVISGSLTQFNKHTIMMALEKEDRLIKRYFCLNAVKDKLKKSFEGEDGTGK